MKADWINCNFEDILTLKNGFAFKSDKYSENGTPVIRISDINDAIVKTTNAKKVQDEENYENYLVEFGDILIAMSGATTGKFGIYKEQNKAYQNQRVGNFKLHCEELINKNYIYYLLYALRRQIEKDAYGGAQPNISSKKIEAMQITLAPLLEQKAIVAKIEQLFSELDNGIANLKTAQAKLKIYRQAVLKKAFEGELTKEWREKQTNLPTADELLEQIKKEREVHYKQQLEEWKLAVKDWEENGKNGKKPSRISKPKILEEVTVEEIDIYGKLPISWKWEKFNNVTHKIGDIDHKMPKPSENGIPYLSTGNIYADGTMDFENAKTISEEDYKRLALKIKPEKNDIIFPRYGTIGRNILVNIDKKFLVSYSCAIIKNVNKYINAKYAHYYSLSPVIKKEIKRYTVQTTQANIGIASIENFVFPLCSLEEQNQIVQEIESRLSVCDKIEETIETSLAKSEALRQSILKCAFEGKLLSVQELENIKNHPEYESAEALIKRIKKEKNK